MTTSFRALERFSVCDQVSKHPSILGRGELYPSLWSPTRAKMAVPTCGGTENHCVWGVFDSKKTFIHINWRRVSVWCGHFIGARVNLHIPERSDSRTLRTDSAKSKLPINRQGWRVGRIDRQAKLSNSPSYKSFDGD